MSPVYDIVETLEGEIPVLKITYSQLVTAILVLIIGIIAVRLIVALFKESMKKSNMPKLMVDFLGKLISAILYVAIVIFTLGTVGIEIGGIFIGLSAALGLIIAFGMQDSLNNMFAGVWLATLRPIRMDEVVEVSGHTGKVSGLSVMSTELLTPDNKYITIPNRQVWGSPIINYTRMPIRRVDINVGVAYGTDLDRAIKAARNVMARTGLVIKDPPMDVVVTELGDSAINLQLRPWTKTENYWILWGQLKKDIPDYFSKAGIDIPFPQLDITVSEKK
jgi:small-conductance mechanosensitive channel